MRKLINKLGIFRKKSEPKKSIEYHAKRVALYLSTGYVEGFDKEALRNYVRKLKFI